MSRAIKSTLLVTGLLFFVGCAASGPSIRPPVRPGPAVAAPVYRDGDQWVYQIVRQRGNEEQVRISYRNGKFENDNPEIFNSPILATVHLVDGEPKPLDFPLVPGKTWTYKYQATRSRRRSDWRDAEVSIIGSTMQPVKTPAGQFQAVEIVRYETWGRTERKSTYFYSAETKSIVRLIADVSSPAGEQHYEMELLKYSAEK